MNWHVEAKRVLRAEMVRKGVSVEELSVGLARIGVTEAPKSLAVKISRGKFQLAFFLQCMAAMGADSVSIVLPAASAD